MSAIITFAERTVELVHLLEYARKVLAHSPIPEMKEFCTYTTEACAAARASLQAALDEDIILRVQIARDGAILRDIAALPIEQTAPEMTLRLVKISAQAVLDARSPLIGDW